MINPKPGERVRWKEITGKHYDGEIISLDEKGNARWRVDGIGMRIDHPSHLIRLSPKNAASFVAIPFRSASDLDRGVIVSDDLFPFIGRNIRLIVKTTVKATK